eukprot:1781337-Pyramimonas_sp.AAC.1
MMCCMVYTCEGACTSVTAGTSFGTNPRHLAFHHRQQPRKSRVCRVSRATPDRAATKAQIGSGSLRKSSEGRDEKAYQQTTGEGQLHKLAKALLRWFVLYQQLFEYESKFGNGTVRVVQFPPWRALIFNTVEQGLTYT